MNQSIVTQVREIVNYSGLSVIQLLPFTSNVAVGETNTVWVVAGFPKAATPPSDEPSIDELIQLGIYRSEAQAEETVDKLINWLERGNQPVFRMPDGDEE